VKLLLDANLSPEVARLLKEVGHDAMHVRDIGLLSAPDPEILQAACPSPRRLSGASLSHF
jgi:predicted nuclease of predicted toxin-antitoxin system